MLQKSGISFVSLPIILLKPFAMIRTIVVPDKDHIVLSIPKDFIGVEIEVIAFSKEEQFLQKITQNKIEISGFSNTAGQHSEFVPRRKTKIREGWNAAFAQYAMEGEDKPMLPDFLDTETNAFL